MTQPQRRIRAWRWSEERRIKAWELAQKGWTQQRIAEALGVTQSSVSQWLTRARAEGTDALRTRKPKGRTPRLSLTQREGLLAFLARGPAASGFGGEVWTLARIAEVIEREFGVSYRRSQVCRILKASGWSGKESRAAGEPEPPV